MLTTSQFRAALCLWVPWGSKEGETWTGLRLDLKWLLAVLKLNTRLGMCGHVQSWEFVA